MCDTILQSNVNSNGKCGIIKWKIRRVWCNRQPLELDADWTVALGHPYWNLFDSISPRIWSARMQRSGVSKIPQLQECIRTMLHNPIPGRRHRHSAFHPAVVACHEHWGFSVASFQSPSLLMEPLAWGSQLHHPFWALFWRLLHFTKFSQARLSLVY